MVWTWVVEALLSNDFAVGAGAAFPLLGCEAPQSDYWDKSQKPEDELIIVECGGVQATY